MTLSRSPLHVRAVLAAVLSGALATATIFWGQDQLGLTRFAPLAQLWTLWALAAASLTFGVQQWVIRQLIAGVPRRALLGRALLLSLFPAVVAVVLATVFVGDWFDNRYAFVPLSGLVVLGSGLAGHARGLAAVGETMRTFVGVVVGENLIRMLAMIPLALVDASVEWYGVGVVAGFLVAPIAWRSGDGPTRVTTAAGHPWLASAVGAVGYTTMFGAPLLLGATGSADEEVSAMFLVFSIGRVPFVLMIGVLPFLAVWSETVASHGESDVRRIVAGRVLVGCVAAAGIVAVTAWLSAEETIGALLETNSVVGNSVWAMVGAASLLAVGCQVLTVLGLALPCRRRLAAVWMIPVVFVAIAVTTSLVMTPERIAAGLVALQGMTALALSLHVRSATVAFAR